MVLTGIAREAIGEVEVVFHTSMTGYQAMVPVARRAVFSHRCGSQALGPVSGEGSSGAARGAWSRRVAA